MNKSVKVGNLFILFVLAIYLYYFLFHSFFPLPVSHGMLAEFRSANMTIG